MSKKEALAELLHELRAQALRGDPEAAHWEGDGLLVRTIAVLASGTQNSDAAQQIIKAFQNLKKWYA